MSTLLSLLPDFTDEDESLPVALRAIRQGPEEIEALMDRLLNTAVEKDGRVYFRPYAAARAWLKTHPEWISELTGKEGIKYRNLSEALEGLAEQQASLDALLALEIPTHLQTSVRRTPGPTLTAWE